MYSRLHRAADNFKPQQKNKTHTPKINRCRWDQKETADYFGFTEQILTHKSFAFG